MTGGAARFGTSFGAGFNPSFFAPGGGTVGRHQFSVTSLVAAGGVGRHGRLASLIGCFGIMRRGIRFRSGRIIFGSGFGGFCYDFFATYRHQEIALGPFAQAQIFLAWQLRNGRLLLILSLDIAPGQEQ